MADDESPVEAEALSSLEPAQGFFVLGVAWSWTGFSVSAAGDINGDGFDDIVRGFAGRFVNDNDPVEGGRFGWTRHNLLDFDKGRFSDVISQEWIEIHAMRGKRTIAGA